MEFEIEGGWRDPVQLIARYPGYHIGSGKDGVWGLQDGKMHCSWLVCCDGLLGAVGLGMGYALVFTWIAGVEGYRLGLWILFVANGTFILRCITGYLVYVEDG